MAETERRRSMDEISEKIGALGAGFVAINSRLDTLALERQQQHVEAIRTMAETAAQQHEIKHDLSTVSSKFDALSHKLDMQGATLNRHVEDDLKQFNQHERIMRESAEAMERQIITNRESSETRDASIMARLDELFAWRNLMRGMWAVISAGIGGLLVIFGHDILEFGKGIFHWGAK